MFCSNCGEKVPSGTRFCPGCGHRLTHSDLEETIQAFDPNQQFQKEDYADVYEQGAFRQENYAQQGYYQDDFYRQQDIPNVYPPGNPPVGPKKPSSGKISVIILTVVIIVLLVVIGVLLVVYFLQSNDDIGGGTDPGSGTVDGPNGPTGELVKRETKLISSDISNYPDVRVYFSIVDDDGEPLLLTSPTATITERVSGGEAIERTVKRVEQLDKNQGIGIDILIDKSGSMEGDFPRMQEVLRSFVNSLDYASGDKAEILSFDDFVMYMCTFTDNPSLLLNGISNMTPNGQTALYDALYSGIINAGSRSGANCVIAFTDGADNASTHTYNEVIQFANSRNIPIYLIGTGGAEGSVLRSIADATGGEYWNVNDITNVSDILEKIYVVQKGMYSVEYTSVTTVEATVERTISCEIRDNDSIGQVENVSFTPHEIRKTKSHSSRYEFVRADVTWNEANEQCIANGGHLATITSQNEMDTIEALAEREGIRYLWIGGYTSVRDNIVYGHWVTGEAFSYSNWDENEPSRYDYDGVAEPYMMLWQRQGVWSWNDQRNDVLHIAGITYFNGNIGYVCEYEDIQ